jgi:hypothetical protein
VYHCWLDIPRRDLEGMILTRCASLGACLRQAYDNVNSGDDEEDC